jgi:hypothetical protein
MASRPLWDPNPQTFVAQDAVKNKDLRRVRLSDFAVIAFAMNITGGHLTKGAVDIFENVYVRGAKPRRTRLHEGHPALAPDGTVMSMDGIAYPGDTGQPAGQWNTTNVDKCPGFANWVAQLRQSSAEMVANGHNIGVKNMPLPDEEELEDANDYQPGGGEDGPSVGGGKKDRKTSGKKSGKKSGRKSSGNPVIDRANKLMETTIDNMTEFAEYVRGAVLDPASQKALLERLYDIAGELLKDGDGDDDDDDDDDSGGSGRGAGNGDDDDDSDDHDGAKGGGAGKGDDDGSHGRNDGSASGGDAASGDNGGDDGAGGGGAGSGSNGGGDGSAAAACQGDGSEGVGNVKRALDGEIGDAGGKATYGGGGDGHGSGMRKRQKVVVLKVPDLGSAAKIPANVPGGGALNGEGQKARGGSRKKGKKAPTSAKFVESEDDIMEDALPGDEAMVGDGNNAGDTD